MDNQLDLKRLLGYKDFFPNILPQSKEDYASKIGKEVLEKFCCLFLSYISYDVNFSVEELLKRWFTFTNSNFHQSSVYWFIQGQFRKIRKAYPYQEYDIISVESLLNMFLWIYDRKVIPTESKSLDGTMAVPLLKLYLLFNDELLVKYENVITSVRAYGEARKIQRLLLAMSFSQSDLINVDYQKLVYCQIYKSIKLLNFIEKSPEYSSLLGLLLEEFGCENKVDFFKSVTSAVVTPMRGRSFSWNVLSTKATINKVKADRVLEILSIDTGEAIVDQDDFKLLRTKPFQKIGDGEYRVIFDLFLVKKLYNGLVFKLSSYDKNFLGKIRDSFSEGVLVYETLNIVLDSDISITGNEFKAVGLKREPDFYSRKNNDILLFESKDFFMPGTSKLSYDFSIIEGELMRDGRFKKAVSQLNANIQRCLKKALPLDNNYDIKKLRIFPVIIVHDSLYSALALNYWIHYWLKDEIEVLKQDDDFKLFDFSIIKPLTIIEIDTLILYQNNFNKDFDLINLLESYHEFVQFGMEVDLAEEEVERHAKKSALSFSKFFQHYISQFSIDVDFDVVSQMLDEYDVN